MRFEIGIENNVDGRSLAWALDWPGCFAYGLNLEGALAEMPAAICDYSTWIISHCHGERWMETDEIRLHLAGKWDVYKIDQDFNLTDDGEEINAWFRHDWKPLTDQDVKRGEQLLAWSHDDLLDTVQGLTPQALQAEHPGERWNIAGILKHVGGSEWWYLDRLGLAFPSQELPQDPFERLEASRACLLKALPSLVGSTQVVGVEGEFWSPRKLLRRAVWHERDHTTHIQKLI